MKGELTAADYLILSSGQYIETLYHDAIARFAALNALEGIVNQEDILSKYIVQALLRSLW